MPQPLPEQLINRELGILEFPAPRAGAGPRTSPRPLLERLRFLCIVSSNMDEFFEVRVAGLKEQIKAGISTSSPDGLTPRQSYGEVQRVAHELVAKQYQLLNQTILPALGELGIRFIRRTQWNEAQAAWIRDYFFRELMPVLTPIGLDPAHPFPRVLNKSLNFAVELKGKDAFGRNSGAAVVQAPRSLPRVIRLPQETAGCEYGFVFLSSILHAHVGELFSGMTVEGCYQFRATRNSDLFVDEEETKNLRQALQGELPHRHFGAAVRLEVADNCSATMADFLLAQFELDRSDLYQVHGPVNLVRLMQVPDWVDRPDLKFPAFTPSLPARVGKAANMFDVINKGDLLLHHPFESFQPVIDFIGQAAIDPQVVAIRQTVYRTGTDSQLMSALIRAAQSGKEVTVVVELLARFDEEANINWAAQLEEAGAHVVYGVVGHKTHAKLGARDPPRGGRPAQLCASGNRQLPCAHGAPVHRLRPDDGEPGHHCRRQPDLHPAHRPGPRRQAQTTAAIALHPAPGNPCRHRARNRRRQGRAARRHHRQDERAARAEGHRRAVRGLASRREDRPHRARRLRTASRRARTVRKHPRALGRRPLPRTHADFLFQEPGRGTDLPFQRRLDGPQFRSADIESCFPVLDPRLKKRVIQEGLKPYLRDNQQSWEMHADGVYRRRSNKRGKQYCAQAELLALYSEK